MITETTLKEYARVLAHLLSGMSGMDWMVCKDDLTKEIMLVSFTNGCEWRIPLPETGDELCFMTLREIVSWGKMASEDAWCNVGKRAFDVFMYKGG